LGYSLNWGLKEEFMKKTCLFFLLVGLTFTALQVAPVAAQTGMPGGQCDPNPACVENCCPAGDPNAPGMPGMGDHQGGMNPQGMPPMGQDCAALHPGGAATHVDPPQAEIDAIETEYRVSCETGNCALSDSSYASLESQGHSRDEVNCFLAEGERSHNEQHGGGMPGGPGDMHGGPGGMPGMGDHQGGMNPQGMTGMGDYQGGMNPQGMTGGQCDPNPACVENCCPAGDPAPDTAPAEDTLLLGPAE